MEQLLRLKKAEQPDRAFWNQFEKQMHQRMFQEAMHSRPSLARRFSAALLHSRILTLGAPAAAALLVFGAVLYMPTAQGTGNGPIIADSAVDMVVSVNAPALDRTKASRESFVRDNLQMNLDNGRYLKVMAAADLPIGGAQVSGIRYVADQLGAHGARGDVLFASNSF